MTRNKGIAALVFFLILLIAGCQKELSLEGAGTLPAAGGGGTGARRCVSCTYLPFCDSSEFTYLLDGTDTAGGLIHLLADTTVGGQNYSRVSGFAAFNGGILYNCANAEYKLALPLSQFGLDADSVRAALQPVLDSLLPVPGASLSLPSTFYATILKANLAGGATWLDTLATINLPFTQGPFTINLRLYVGIEYTYLEKNIPYSVLGTGYTNVQHVQGKPKVGLAAAVPVPLPLPAIDGRVDFYLAKDIGLVEMNAADSTGPITSAKLIRYRL